jgi:hypothetical protein
MALLPVHVIQVLANVDGAPDQMADGVQGDGQRDSSQIFGSCAGSSRHAAGGAAYRPSRPISIVVPTLDEERNAVGNAHRTAVFFPP